MGTSRRLALFLSAGGLASDGIPALQIPVTGTKYHSGGPGAKSCEAGRAPGAPASQGNPGDGVTLGTVELWYFGYHGGRCKRRLCPVREEGSPERKKVLW